MQAWTWQRQDTGACGFARACHLHPQHMSDILMD